MDKKGIRGAVGYVLVFVILIGIATLVFSYLLNLAPKEKLECDRDIELDLLDAICVTNADNSLSVFLTLENTGRHTVDSAFIRLGHPGRKVKSVALNEDPSIGLAGGLKPEDRYYVNQDLSFEKIDSIFSDVGKYSLEIEPAITTNEGLALCNRHLTSYQITCGKE